MQHNPLNRSDIESLRCLIPDYRFPSSTLDSDHSSIKQYQQTYQLTELNKLSCQYGLGGYRSHGFLIAAQYWLPEKPLGTTFIVHGYFDHSGLYHHLIEHLLQQNQAVVCLDLPGHGLSSGDQLSIKSFAQYEGVFNDLLNNCADFPQPFNAIGQSTGGAIILKTLLNKYHHGDSNPFQQVALLAPLVRPYQWLYTLILRTIAKPWVKQIARKHGINSHDQNFLNFLKNIDPLQANFIPLDWVGAMHQWAREFDKAGHCPWPIEVIQGDDDSTVDWQYNTRAIECKFPNSTTTLIPAARHNLVNESPAYRKRIFQHIDFSEASTTVN